MVRHLLVLPDGTEVFSGGNGAAVMALRLTRTVNQGQQLKAGAACAAMLEANLIHLDPGCITAGDALVLYTVDDDGNRQKEGIFLAEKPERTGASTLKLTAYDRLTLLDRDLTAWLKGLTGWPYTLHTLARMVCEACGLQLVTAQIPNGDFPVEAFTAEGVTGRQLMMWIAEAACRFCRATADGDVELSWYAPVPVTLGPSQLRTAQAAYTDGDLSIQTAGGEVTDRVSLTSGYVAVTDDSQGNVTLTLYDALQRQYCFQGGMTLAEYTVAPIEKVQLRQDETDIGTLWPADTDKPLNTYCITGNPLLSAQSSQTLQPVAQTLLQQLKDGSYTPGTLKLPAGQPIQPGCILQIEDPAGRTVSFWVMTMERTGQQDILTCIGEADRDSTGACNDLTYAPVSGKVLRLQADVDGLKIENADNSGKLARLELDVDGIRTRVEENSETAEGLQEKLSFIEQTAESIALQVEENTQTAHSFQQRLSAIELTAESIGLRVEENTQTSEGLQEKLAEIELTAESITSRVEESIQTSEGLQEKMSMLEQSADGIRSQVTAQESTTEGLRQKLSQIEQDADSISATVRSIVQDGTGRVANEFGLTIDGSCVQIHRDGSDMTNQLDETGMYVVRSQGTEHETTMLRADADGVLATDVHVRNYLHIGDYARIEDYSDGTDHRRTACFWTGG